MDIPIIDFPLEIELLLISNRGVIAVNDATILDYRKIIDY